MRPHGECLGLRPRRQVYVKCGDEGGGDIDGGGAMEAILERRGVCCVNGIEDLADSTLFLARRQVL